MEHLLATSSIFIPSLTRENVEFALGKLNLPKELREKYRQIIEGFVCGFDKLIHYCLWCNITYFLIIIDGKTFKRHYSQLGEFFWRALVGEYAAIIVPVDVYLDDGVVLPRGKFNLSIRWLYNQQK